MKPAWRSIALTAVLAALAGAGGAWIGGHAIVGMSPDRPSLHRFVHDDLDLTAAQEARLEAEEARFEARRRVLEAEVRAANAELAQAMEETHVYGPEVQRAVDHFHMAMGELQKETIIHVFAMRAVLTPAQAKKFDERVGAALTQERQ